MADLQQTISNNATKPQTVSVDGMTATQHPLPDQIAADRYLQGAEARRKKWKGLLFQKIAFPGTV